MHNISVETRLQNSRFRKAGSAVSVILECEAREPHTPASLTILPRRFFTRSSLSFEYGPSLAFAKNTAVLQSKSKRALTVKLFRSLVWIVKFFLLLSSWLSLVENTCFSLSVERFLCTWISIVISWLIFLDELQSYVESRILNIWGDGSCSLALATWFIFMRRYCIDMNMKIWTTTDWKSSSNKMILTRSPIGPGAPFSPGGPRAPCWKTS